MDKYNIIFSDYNKQIWVLILFPLLMIAPLVAVLLSLKEISEIAILVSVMVWMALMIIAMIYVVSKQLMVPATLSIGKDGFEIIPGKKTMFYRFESLLITLDNIKSVTDDEDLQQNYRKFFTLKTKHPAKKIMLLAPKNQSQIETEQCTLALHTAIKNYNQSPLATTSGIIQQGSFYSSTFAKVITVCFSILIAVMVVAKIANPEAVPWYKLLAAFSFSFLWFINFFNARKGEKEKLEN